MFRTLSVVVLGIMLTGGNASVAQDSAPTKATTPPPNSTAIQGDSPKSVAKTKTSAASETKKRVDRLPRYFGQLELSSEQRASIYSIQAGYADQIDELMRQIDMLKAEREKQLRANLNASQKRKLTSFSNRTATNPKSAPKEN